MVKRNRKCGKGRGRWKVKRNRKCEKRERKIEGKEEQEVWEMGGR